MIASFTIKSVSDSYGIYLQPHILYRALQQVLQTCGSNGYIDWGLRQGKYSRRNIEETPQGIYSAHSGSPQFVFTIPGCNKNQNVQAVLDHKDDGSASPTQ